MSGTIGYGDEIEKYRVAQSIVERGEISFRPTAVRNIADPAGRTISLYELGQTLLQIPLYALGKFLHTFLPTADVNQLTMLIVGLLNPFLSAFACVAMFETSRALGFHARTALSLAFMYGLASIALPYAQGYAREPLLVLTLLVAVGALFQFERTRAYRWLLVSGFAVGFLVFSKFIQAIVVPFLLVYAALAAHRLYRAAHANNMAVRHKVLRAVLVFLSPVFAFLLAQAIYSFARFGTVLVGYGTKVNPLEWIVFLVAQSQPHIATLGLIFSPVKSYFLYNPLTVLGFWSIPLWWRRHKSQAVLVLALLGIEFLAVIARPDWDGGTWWGPRYLVQCTPLLILSLGFLLESPRFASRAWRWIIGALFGLSIAIQFLGVLGNDRDFLDVMGAGITILGQLDLLRYSALESLFIYLLPVGLPINISPATLVLVPTVVILGILLWTQWRHDALCPPVSRGRTALWLAGVLALELGAFIVWIVAPYPRVLTAQANTRFTSAERLLANQRVCEAYIMYRLALDRGTTFQSQAIARYEHIEARLPGIAIPADELMSQIEMSNGARPTKDLVTALTPEGALKLHIPGNRDATIMLVSTPIAVTPNTPYQVAGWWKTLNIYGTRYASVALYQDDGNWQHSRTTDIALLDETHGWQPFQHITTTLPTTQRVMIKVALWQTYGTVWVDDVRLIANPRPAPVCR